MDGTAILSAEIIPVLMSNNSFLNDRAAYCKESLSKSGPSYQYKHTDVLLLFATLRCPLHLIRKFEKSTENSI